MRKSPKYKIATPETISASKELQFYRLQVECLLGVLNEIYTFTGPLEQKVIENAKERHELDKIIHAKLIFKP